MLEIQDVWDGNTGHGHHLRDCDLRIAPRRLLGEGVATHCGGDAHPPRCVAGIHVCSCPYPS